MIRFPDGNRVTKDIPCSSQFLVRLFTLQFHEKKKLIKYSKLQAIIKFVSSEGFSLENHEIVTNFPRRILTDLDTSQTLKDLGLFPKETVFVQQK